LAAFGLVALGAAVVAALGLSLLAGDTYEARLGLRDAPMLLTPTDLNAFLACPSTLRPETQTPTTTISRGGVTTFRTQGRVQALSYKQLLRKAECLRRRGLITNQTLAAVRSQASATPHGDLVPWWAPTAVVPSWAAVLVWSLLLIAELVGVAALVLAIRRKRRPVVASQDTLRF
jgi:hypothetical protein